MSVLLMMAVPYGDLTPHRRSNVLARRRGKSAAVNDSAGLLVECIHGLCDSNRSCREMLLEAQMGSRQALVQCEQWSASD